MVANWSGSLQLYLMVNPALRRPKGRDGSPQRSMAWDRVVAEVCGDSSARPSSRKRESPRGPLRVGDLRD